MPFPFELPTTSSTNISEYIRSRSHPSLPLTATARRSAVKDTLKRYKRLHLKDKAANLTSIEDAIRSYLPYLLVLGGELSSEEEVVLEIVKPFQAEWRSTLSSTTPGREPPRPKLTGIQHEVAFTLTTLAYTLALQARSHLRTLYDGTLSSSDQRTSAVITAIKYLLEAHNIYQYLLTVPGMSAPIDAVDVLPETLSGLSSLILAEANMIFVTKDDPYAAAVADDRNDSNIDWMYKAPTISKVRASLYSRICLAAAEHASQAHGLFLRTGKLGDNLVKYANDLRRTARAKAIRLLAINSEALGSTGEALAWLQAAKRELGVSSELEDGKRRGLRGLKQSWQERREDRRVEKGGEWGMDAGRLEEARIIEMLEMKWDKENSTINVQIVPPYEPLLRQLPSGRDPHTIQPWTPPILDPSELARMRAPPDPAEVYQGEEDDSGAEEAYNMPSISGAFPGSQDDRRSASTYY